MPVNPQLPPEQRKMEYLNQITTALESIAAALSHEFGPMKVQKLVNPSEEMTEQWKENEEIERRETEIQELKKANSISSLTAKIAVIGLLLTALIGSLQLTLDWIKYRDEKTTEVKSQQFTSSQNPQ
jgi:hypothetical protein